MKKRPQAEEGKWPLETEKTEIDALLSSVPQLCPTLCDPVYCSIPGFPVHHQLLELAQTHVQWISDAIQPSHPLSSPSPPAFNHSQYQLCYYRVFRRNIALYHIEFSPVILLPIWLSSKESACNVGDVSSIPGLGRSPREGNGSPLHYSCLGNLMDRGVWWVIVHRVAKGFTQLSTKKQPTISGFWPPEL